MSLKEYKVEDIAKIKYGKMPPKDIIKDSGYPVFSGYGITGYASNYNTKEPSVVIIARGVGGTGKVKISPEKAWITNLCLILDTDKKLVNDYFLYNYLGLMNLKSKLDTGSAQSQITVNSLAPFKISLPKLETQEKIADILSAYDDLIENNLKRIELLEEQAQLTYEEWFVRMKFPGHECAVIDSETDLPKGWNIVKLKDICRLIMGQSPKSEFYNYDGEGLPFHQGVKDFGFRFPENNTWSTEGNRIAEKDSILFSVRAPVGRLNVAIEKIVLGRGLAAINHKDGLNSLLLYQLQSIFFRDNLMGGGTIFNSVTKKDIEGIKLVQPSKDLAEQFNALAKNIDDLIKNLSLQNKLLKEARDILLPRLMTGMIEV